VLRESLMDLCNFTLLPDPATLVFDQQRWLLSHGDALCLADVDYLKFREQVRSAAWQHDFLAQPLPQRRLIGRDLRAQSEAAHTARNRAGLPWADVDADAARDLLRQSGAPVLIHGHTHRPAEHELGGGLRRIVLSDWDTSGTAAPPRAEVLRLAIGHAPQRIALAL
jgi:UDP-2,3-diacylglucosamine hydrolase